MPEKNTAPKHYVVTQVKCVSGHIYTHAQRAGGSEKMGYLPPEESYLPKENADKDAKPKTCGAGDKLIYKDSITIIQSKGMIEIECVDAKRNVIYLAIEGNNGLLLKNNEVVETSGFIATIQPKIKAALANVAGEGRDAAWAALDLAVSELALDSIALAMKQKKGETDEACAARMAATIQKSEKRFPQIQEIVKVLRANPHLEAGVADRV